MFLSKNIKGVAQVFVIIHFVLAVLSLGGPFLLLGLGATDTLSNSAAAAGLMMALVMACGGCLFWIVTAVPWMILYMCAEMVDAVDRAHRGIAKSVNSGNEKMADYYAGLANGLNVVHAKLSEGVDRGYDVVDRLEKIPV